MKVLLIIDSLTSGGKERRFVELLKGLKNDDRLQCEVVILSDVVHYKEILALNYTIHNIIRKTKKDFTVFAKLYKICRKFKPDIIHSWESMASIYALPIAKIFHAKFINAMIAFAPDHLPQFSNLWVRSKLTFPFSDIILSNSYAGLKAFKVLSEKGVYIHNGFDLERLNKITEVTEVRSKFNIKTKYIVGMVGAFSDRKDYKTFLSAAIKLITNKYSITFLAVGTGPNMETSMAMANSDQIIFTGLQHNIESIINIFDIGVLTTNQKVHGEGISNAIMEYMALGKPVIATRGGGNGEIVVDNKTGFLIEYKDVEALVSKIEHLISNVNLMNEMGNMGRGRILQEFNLEKMTAKYVSLYEDVLKKNSVKG